MTQPQGPSRYVTTPRPRDVPAFGRAQAAGLTPLVTLEPPQVSVRPTARSARRDVAVVGVAAVAAIVTVLLVAGQDGRLSWPAVASLLGVSAVAVAALAVAVRRWGRSLLAELQQGYTTCTFKLGRFWVGAAPDGPVSNGWVQWDWDATWVLRPDGGVESAPSDGGDPPGLYPSPRREGVLELWTGHQWTGYMPSHDT
jgi:biotin operon repressor